MKTNYEKIVESFDDMELKDDLLVRGLSGAAFCWQRQCTTLHSCLRKGSAPSVPSAMKQGA